MQENKIDFDQLKKEVGLVLDASIRTNETIAAITEFNGDPFEGMLMLEEAKALHRVIGLLSPTKGACDLIAPTLKAVSGRSKDLGADVMAYEAGALLAWCEMLARQIETEATTVG